MGERPTVSFLDTLTKPKGAMLAVPAILVAAVALSMASSDEVPASGEKAAKAATTGSAAAGGASAARQEAPKGDTSAADQVAAAASKPAGKEALTEDQKREIGKLVREYLLANPALLTELEQRRDQVRAEEEQREREKVLVTQKDQIFRSPHDYVLGNKDGDITIVEYFDYNCGWCKRALNEVANLVNVDKRVRIVMKEFPIFGDHSTFAAKAAMAANKQGKYWDLHVAMMRAERVTTQNTLQIAKSVGIDVEALKKEMENPIYDAAIAENTELATRLGMQGTPAFIVDTQVNFGYVPLVGLQQMLADIRKEGCKIC